MFNDKWIVFSKTFWFGMLNVLAGITGVLLGSDLIQNYPQVVSFLVIANGAAQILLRAVTKKPVTIMKKESFPSRRF